MRGKMCYNCSVFLSRMVRGKARSGMKIRIGIFGYGNLGRGVENAIRQNPDMELVAVFTRREPGSLTIGTAGVPVCAAAARPTFRK